MLLSHAVCMYTDHRKQADMAGMITVDIRNTFSALFMTACGPKIKFNPDRNAPPEQDVTNAGEPKWELQVAASYHTRPGQRAQSEILFVTIVGGSDPAANVAPGPVEIDGLRCGLSAPEMGERGIKGGKLWWQADAVRPLNGQRTKGEAA